jgi:hypothetical protein
VSTTVTPAARRDLIRSHTPEEAEDLTVGDLEADPVHGVHRSAGIPLGEVPYDHHRRLIPRKGLPRAI